MPPPSHFRGCLHSFSTATQRTAGEDCGSEDPPDELGPSLAERALKLKAVKLEKEVQDLTVSGFYIICSSHTLWFKYPSKDFYVKFLKKVFSNWLLTSHSTSTLARYTRQNLE